MLRFRLAVIAAALTVAAAAPGAQAAAPPDAQGFADAAKKAKTTINALAFEPDAADFALCEKVVEGADPPKRVREKAETLLGLSLINPVFQASKPAIAQLVADLDAIPTTDPALIGGRDGWRVWNAEFQAIPDVATPCLKLRKWQKAKWSKAAEPDVDWGMFDELESSASRKADKAVRRAVKRMRALGVKKGDAERLTGDELFDGALENMLAESPEEL